MFNRGKSKEKEDSSKNVGGNQGTFNLHDVLFYSIDFFHTQSH